MGYRITHKRKYRDVKPQEVTISAALEIVTNSNWGDHSIEGQIDESLQRGRNLCSVLGVLLEQLAAKKILSAADIQELLGNSETTVEETDDGD